MQNDPNFPANCGLGQIASKDERRTNEIASITHLHGRKYAEKSFENSVEMEIYERLGTRLLEMRA